MHLTLWCIVLVCHQNDVCKNHVGSVYVGGYGGLSKNGLLSSRLYCSKYMFVIFVEVYSHVVC